jgi:hypothetical protein
MVSSPLVRLFTVLALLLLAGTASAQGRIQFGDDSSEWSFDGECDDPRFEGRGMASALLDEDRFRDATDCRKLLEGAASG